MIPLLLAIDTSGASCAVCLYDATRDVVRAARAPEIGRGHAERLMPLIDEVLAEAGTSYGAIGRIAVTVGPGSFTGLRVGVAAARALGLALGAPSVGVTTLEALAAPHAGAAPVLAVQDAKRGEIYAALYDRDGAEVRAPAALTPDALAAFVDPAGERLRIVGSGAAIAFERLGPEGVAFVDAQARVAIADVARIGAVREASAPPRPLYLRGADAKPQAASGLRAAVGGA
ncbi:tRNA (adenosine(37)-N6)-threonylcarbamoyltransferase complex dimerization subunit type 1 TsaB [Mangrovibrevibacter kandeliae]|uniref:tRNA (adenosine(37)-N6)-threonylcarbamoyltransferase complex dimerization subunit type 1 TsaB n=1 Tax=Mangrovibrevibacter kandeliae TaxID=2968473 RepID=UPI002118BE7A|nr:tRNA (adenosine(37)-N6)-threonylcarbamoyltransferase complex dimerization subunit type 1 TsaB [Aurantimonas sp. CSK15Z-1]MCQ8782177.1 tRNA (adenosine(37)-N6)-threonylcarbamoyltransferase complex dimerization subunit type 1 TsaB [Aurantimonas sp. CSK15Z-1]